MNVLDLIVIGICFFFLIKTISALLLEIRDFNKVYVLVNAKVKNISTYINESRPSESIYRAELEYEYNSKVYTSKHNYSREADCKNDFVKIYVEYDNPNKSVTTNQYISIKKNSNFVTIIIYLSAFIILILAFLFKIFTKIKLS